MQPQSDFPEYQQLCQQLLYQTENREELELQMRSFLTQSSHLDRVFDLMVNSTDFQLQLITIESWNKIYSVLLKKRQGTSLVHIEESKNKSQLCLLFDKILCFMVKYIFSLDLSRTPIFIINTLANSIAEFTKIQLSRPGLSQTQALKQALSLAEERQSLQVHFVSLVICDYVLKNLFLDSQNFNFFVFKAILAEFRTDFLFEILKSVQSLFLSTEFNGSLFSAENAEVLRVAAQVLNDCLNFPFQVNYCSYDQIEPCEEASYTMFPQEFVTFFLKGEFYQSICSILRAQLNKELNYRIGENLVKMCTSRQSIFDPGSKAVFQGSLIECFLVLYDSSPQNGKFQELLVDYALKIITFFGFHGKWDNVERGNEFEKRVLALSQGIIFGQKKFS